MDCSHSRCLLRLGPCCRCNGCPPYLSPTRKALNGLQPLQVLAQAGAVLPLGCMQVMELALRLAAGQPLGCHREQVAQLLEGKVLSESGYMMN